MATRRRGRINPTIKDVAKAARVAPSTVSRVFTRPELISEATASRVLEVAGRLGYAPDQAARSLSTGRKDAVALLVPDIANPFFPPLIKAVERYFQERGIGVLLAETDEEPEREAELAGTIRGRSDGIIMASPRSDASNLMAITWGAPLVLVNREVPGISRVLIDTAQGVRDAVDHLIRLGHSTLAYLAGPAQSWANEQRAEAFRERCNASRVQHSIVHSRRPDYESGLESAPAVLRTRATGVLAFDDTLALGLMAGLIRVGSSVPHDVSVIGCDDLAAGTAVPKLTSINAPIAQAGAMAAQRLEHLMIAGPGSLESEYREWVPSSLVIRSSTAHAPPSSQSITPFRAGDPGKP